MELTWLLCNKCFIHISDSTVPFSLTQCGHLFCARCITKVGSVCPVCNANGIQSVTLATPLQPMFAPMFSDPLEPVEKLLFGLKFQKCQWKILEQREKEMAKKYMALKNAYWQMSKELKKATDAYNQMKEAYEKFAARQGPPANQNIFNEPPKNRRVNFIGENIGFGRRQQIHHNPFGVMDCSHSEDSDASGSTIRNTETSMTPDGMFRVPTVPKVPRSTGTTSNSSRDSTPVFNYRGPIGRYGNDEKSFYPR